MLNLLLISDPMFRALNIPLSPEDRKELDRKIRRGEPVDPVISWKGYILTGYEQDDIFLKYRKSSAAVTKEMYFPRRSDAVAWLCHQQLKRTDLIWTAKAWLISKLYIRPELHTRRLMIKDRLRRHGHPHGKQRHF